MKEGETEESSVSESQEVKPEVSMAPLPYQVELLDRAKERNTIVFLGTGTGKTFISVMLIKEMAHQVRETYKNGGKRTFFLVNTGLCVFLIFSFNKIFYNVGLITALLKFNCFLSSEVTMQYIFRSSP